MGKDSCLELKRQRQFNPKAIVQIDFLNLKRSRRITDRTCLIAYVASSGSRHARPSLP